MLRKALLLGVLALVSLVFVGNAFAVPAATNDTVSGYEDEDVNIHRAYFEGGKAAAVRLKSYGGPLVIVVTDCEGNIVASRTTPRIDMTLSWYVPYSGSYVIFVYNPSTSEVDYFLSTN